MKLTKFCLAFEQRNISSPDGQNYYQLIDKATGKVFMQGPQHPDFKPSGPRMQRVGGGMQNRYVVMPQQQQQKIKSKKEYLEWVRQQQLKSHNQ